MADFFFFVVPAVLVYSAYRAFIGLENLIEMYQYEWPGEE